MRSSGILKAIKVFLICLGILSSLAAMAIYVYPAESFAFMENNLRVIGCNKLAAQCIEMQIRLIEEDRIPTDSNTQKHFVLFIYNMHLALMYSDEINDYDRAIEIIDRARRRFKEECDSFNCDFELSYCLYKKGEYERAYEILKGSKMGRKVNNRSEMIKELGKYDLTRRKRELWKYPDSEN